ncbi:hypothetical protein [Flavobacterium sp.]|uniref:hypothetical protein n=1 Tax=Flavobacterium sp. TaxID=239 RepID=UPI003753B988
MTPNKYGQVTKFLTPLQKENPDQLCVNVEIIENAKMPRVDIEALNTGLSFPPLAQLI